MNERQWKRILARDQVYAPALTAELQQLLAEEADADPGGARLAARTRVRNRIALAQSHARVKLAAAMIDALHITSTQTVAKLVMDAAFHKAVRTAWLDDAFAQTGRRAVVKYTRAAHLALETHPAIVRQARSLYNWHARLLARRVRELDRLQRGGEGAPRAWLASIVLEAGER